MVKHINNGDRAMIQRAMGDIHVGKSELWVARYWLKRGLKAKLAKGLRFEIARHGLKVHRENGDLFRYVTGGIR